MRLPLFIAWRYLFAHKKLGAINIVTRVSVLAIAVVSMTMICVLSIYNGYEQMILDKVVGLDPQLLITKGDEAPLDQGVVTQEIRSIKGIRSIAPLVWGEGLVSRMEGESFSAAHLYGVDSTYLRIANMERYLYSGDIAIHPGQYNLGASIALNLNTIAHDTDPLVITLPKRKGYINPIMPMTSLRRSQGVPVSVLFTDNVVYDNSIFIPLSELRSLLMLDENQAHGLALQLDEGADEGAIQKAIATKLGEEYLVRNRPEQQPHLMRLVAIEKWITSLIFAFILLLAAYNVMASISMLLISKQEDIAILHALGETPREIRRTFQLEGLMVTLIGAVGGIAVGIVLCLLQMRFGWLTMDLVVESQPYPVAVRLTDLLVVLLLVFAVGYLAAVYPVRKLIAHRNASL
ncbi:MAG: FtsX-like permease family protein [Porphyromonas asaccharolytica]